MLNPKEISDLSSSAQAKRTIGGKVEVGPKYPCLWVVMIETLIIWMLVGLGVLAWYFSGQLPFYKVSESESETVTEVTYTQEQLRTDTGIDLQGWLMFTLAPKDTPDIGVETFVYDFSSGQHEILYPSFNSLTGRVATFSLFHSVSSDRSWVSYIGGVETSDEAAHDQVMQVFRAPLSVAGSDPMRRDVFSETQRQASQVSERSGLKNIPQINNQGDVLYTVLTRTDGISLEFPIAEENVIYFISGESGQERYLIEGSKPRWVSENTFIFLRNDGLYSHNLDTGRTSQVLPQQTFGGEVYTNVGIAASDDGSLFVISVPELARVAVYSVADWSKPVPKFINATKVTGFWPTFSPDGRVLALQSVDRENIDSDPKPKVVFYEIDETKSNPTGGREALMKQLPFTIDMDEFEQEQMFITDWIN